MTEMTFTLSLISEVTLTEKDDKIILQAPIRTALKKATPTRQVIFEHPQSGLISALNYLKSSQKTHVQMKALVVATDGKAAGENFDAELQKLINTGWVCHSVFPLATAIPIVEKNYRFESPEIEQLQGKFTLSRFAYLHQDQGTTIIECPLSQSKIVALDWRCGALLAKLSQPQTASSLSAEIPNITEEIAQKFLALLMATQMLSPETEPTPLMYWEFHDLLYHSRSRMGRHNNPSGGTMRFLGKTEHLPIVKPPMSDKVIKLVQPNLEYLSQIDIPLTKALELRQSIREYDEQPIRVQQLGKLLYCCARIKKIETMETEEFGTWHFSYRPYPCGGAIYELEVYPVVNRCQGLEAGVYHYQPLEHCLYQISDWNADVEELIEDAYKSSGEQDKPQILLVITARFGRLFWKYESIAYALILKHVGVLYQTFYLMATGMHLAPCALGIGDSDHFAKITGLDYYEESSVGEFLLGSVRS
ncbi:MAG: SagB/ThcOx family dehydrogenase [Okeania sp. SIO3I5]|nr:SagB/ThcOx family dehydrogenase [Okeania sp. SIO3I5]